MSPGVAVVAGVAAGSVARILAVESSCDETSVSIVDMERSGMNASAAPGAGAGGAGNGKRRVRVLAHAIESQIESHRPFGGVVPEVAARDHLAKIHQLAQDTLAGAGVTLESCDALAVTMGPGLIGALMVGVLYARGAALAASKPLLAVNHVDAHLAPCFFLESFSPRADLGTWMESPHTPFPALALTVSGGHCILSRLESPVEREILGQTSDDACGEAFDKVAKLLGLPYPGGPEIEALARAATQDGPRFAFPHRIADRANTLGFSFSGLKTSVLDAVRKEMNHTAGKASGAALPQPTKAALAAAFQAAALGQLVDRMGNALREAQAAGRPYGCVLVAGGVAANGEFRAKLANLGLPVRFAPLSLCSDNATMIALQAHLEAIDGDGAHPFPRYAQWASKRNAGHATA